MPITIDEVVSRIPAWRGRTIAVAPLGGGLTNTNFRIDVGDETFVVRIPGAQTELLAIDRDNEYHNTNLAAQIGVGPRVYHFLADYQVMVLEHIAGPTLCPTDLHRPEMPGRLAQSLRALHSGPRFLHDFDMLALAKLYLETIDRISADVPAGLRERLNAMTQVERALAARPLPAAPCHNDLLAGNLIDDGKSLRIVDFEYSGNNDPCFELGNTCQEQEYGADQIAELCRAYFGRHDAAQLARVKLNMIVSDFGWSLWAAIQTRISQIDFDFWEYGTNRWRRAQAKLEGTEFGAWLRDAAT